MDDISFYTVISRETKRLNLYPSKLCKIIKTINGMIQTAFNDISYFNEITLIVYTKKSRKTYKNK